MSTWKGAGGSHVCGLGGKSGLDVALGVVGAWTALEVRAGETPKDVMWTEKGTAPGGLGAGPAKWGPGAGGGPALSEWGGGRRARAGGCQLRGMRRPPDLSAGSQAP